MKTARRNTSTLWQFGWLCVIAAALVNSSVFAWGDAPKSAQDSTLDSQETAKLARRRPAKEGAFNAFPTETPNVAAPAPAAPQAAQTAPVAPNAAPLPMTSMPAIAAPVAAVPAPAVVANTISATGELPGLKWVWLSTLGLLTLGTFALGAHLVLRKEVGAPISA